jgi:hypothetical protein
MLTNASEMIVRIGNYMKNEMIVSPVIVFKKMLIALDLPLNT